MHILVAVAYNSSRLDIPVEALSRQYTSDIQLLRYVPRLRRGRVNVTDMNIQYPVSYIQIAPDH